MATQHLLAKVNGFIESISRMSSDERLRSVSLSFGRDYNGLLESLKIEASDVLLYLPPQADIGRNAYDAVDCFTTFGEIMTWCYQIR
jgi:hypothetical protein